MNSKKKLKNEEEKRLHVLYAFLLWEMIIYVYTKDQRNVKKLKIHHRRKDPLVFKGLILFLALLIIIIFLVFFILDI